MSRVATNIDNTLKNNPPKMDGIVGTIKLFQNGENNVSDTQ
jgi:hypothetical protein